MVVNNQLSESEKETPHLRMDPEQANAKIRTSQKTPAQRSV